MALEAVPILPASDCQADCRLVAHVRDGVFLGLEGEDGVPPCPACLSAVREAQAPSRPTTPLRARGVDRGADGPDDMESAAWDEVIDRAAYVLGEAARGQRRVVWLACGERPRLSQIVPRRLGGFIPDLTLVRRLPPREAVARLVASMLADNERAGLEACRGADVIVVWGMDPREGARRAWLEIARALDGGARLVVVDPRASATVREGALHLPLRPATDTALALGLAERLRAAGRGRAREIPALLAGALEAWPAARAAEVCGVPQPLFEEAARLLVEARAPVLVVGGGAGRHAEALNTLQALAILARIAGAPVVAPAPAPDPALALPLPVGVGGAREVAPGELDRELRGRDPRRDVVVVDGGDPLLEFPGGGDLPGYLRQAGFVLVLTDTWTPVCCQADLVLPLPSILERTDAVGMRWPIGVRTGYPAVPVRRDTLPDATIWRRITRRLGWPEQWFPADWTESVRAAAREGAPVPRIAGLPSRWEPPQHREAGEGPRAAPDTYRAFRLFLVPARASGALCEGAGTIVLSAPDAAQRGIADGDRVIVHNDRAKVPAIARIDAAEPPGIATLCEPWPLPRRPAPRELLPPQRGGGLGHEVPGPCLVEVNRVI